MKHECANDSTISTLSKINELARSSEHPHRVAVLYVEYLYLNPKMEKVLWPSLVRQEKISYKRLRDTYRPNNQDVDDIIYQNRPCKDNLLCFDQYLSRPGSEFARVSRTELDWWRLDIILADNPHGGAVEYEIVSGHVDFPSHKLRLTGSIGCSIIVPTPIQVSCTELKVAVSNERASVMLCASKLTNRQFLAHAAYYGLHERTQASDNVTVAIAMKITELTGQMPHQQGSIDTLSLGRLASSRSLYEYEFWNSAYLTAQKSSNLREFDHNKKIMHEGVKFKIEGVKFIGNLIVVHGWVIDPQNDFHRVVVKLSSLQTYAYPTAHIARYSRPDVEQVFGSQYDSCEIDYGFVCTMTIEDLAVFPETVDVGFQSKSGDEHIESITTSKIAKTIAGLENLMGVVPNMDFPLSVCNQFYRPVFNQFTQSLSETVSSKLHVFPSMDRTDEPTHYEMSIIVPLYGPIRFEKSQMPIFASLAKRHWELIFAVDDPSIVVDVCNNVEQMAFTLGLTVKVISVDKNLGYSGINNVASEYASGKFLLFLNSDCFVTSSDPIERALRWLNSTENAGAAGFRLLYADHSIQHNGMALRSWQGKEHLYINEHPGKGSEPKEADLEGDACLLTAACLIVSKSLFFDVNGFDQSYFRGDFEDSDLCIKILRMKKILGIVTSGDIFHLERQTIPCGSAITQSITLVNSFIFTSKWTGQINRALPPLELIQ